MTSLNSGESRIFGSRDPDTSCLKHFSPYRFPVEESPDMDDPITNPIFKVLVEGIPLPSHNASGIENILRVEEILYLPHGPVELGILFLEIICPEAPVTVFPADRPFQREDEVVA
jgi:hypothetical protein